MAPPTPAVDTTAVLPHHEYKSGDIESLPLKQEAYKTMRRHHETPNSRGGEPSREATAAGRLESYAGKGSSRNGKPVKPWSLPRLFRFKAKRRSVQDKNAIVAFPKDHRYGSAFGPDSDLHPSWNLSSTSSEASKEPSISSDSDVLLQLSNFTVDHDDDDEEDENFFESTVEHVTRLQRVWREASKHNSTVSSANSSSQN